MVTTQKTWRFSLSQPLSSSNNQVDQYKEAFFALKSWFVSASWTVTMSAGLAGGASGSFTASVGDNILSKNDVVYGTLGTNTSSYFVVEPPADWLPSGSSVEPFQLCFVPNATAGNSNPRTMSVISLSGRFKLNGTNPNVKTPVAVTGSLITCSNAQNFLANTTPTAQKWHGWRTTDGDVMFGLSDGLEMDYFFWVTSFNNDRGNGEGKYKLAIYTPPAGNALGYGSLRNAGYWNTYSTNGTAASVTPVISCWGWWFLGWTYPGFSTPSHSPVMIPLDFGDIGGTTGRHIGRIVDVSGSPGSTVAISPSNVLVDGDIDSIRLCTVGNLWIPTPTGSIPIQF